MVAGTDLEATSASSATPLYADLGSPPWYRRRGSTRSDTTASSHPTPGCGPGSFLRLPEASDPTPSPPSSRPKPNTGARTYRVPWADLLKKVFAVDVLACPDCGGRLQIIAFIADDTVARRILLHLRLDSRGPPVARAQAPPDFSEPGPSYDGADPLYAD